MTAATDILAHASQFTFQLSPGVTLTVAQTPKGYLAWREFERLPNDGDKWVSHARYLKRDGTYGWLEQDGAVESDFYFARVEYALIAAGDTFVTLTPEEVQQLKEPQPCQT